VRSDAWLNHLHWATTRRQAPPTLLGLTIRTASAPPAKRARLRQLAGDAVARVAAQRPGCGIVLDESDGTAAGPHGAHEDLWVARSVHREGARPLEFETAGSLAATLTEWPIDVTVSCQCHYHPDDPPELREAEERNLLRLAAACRAQGRELLLWMTAEQPLARQPDVVVRALERLYELEIRPDWWQLEPQSESAAWTRCAEVIARHDPYCRGILVSTPSGEATALLALAAAAPAVRGFIA